MDRRTLASPPPDFGLDDPTLEHPISDFDVHIAELDRGTPTDPYGDRATLPDGALEAEERHDTDPAPPPDDVDPQ